MSMLVPNKHPLPEISSSAYVAALRAPLGFDVVEAHFSATSIQNDSGLPKDLLAILR
jgi:hypothetical protein